MKHALLFAALKALNEKPILRRRLKAFALVGAVVLFVSGGLAVWATVSAVQYFAAQANWAVQSPAVHTQVESLKAQLNALPTPLLVPLHAPPHAPRLANCWAQALLSIQSWLERPPAETLDHLKVACLEEKKPSCEGTDCAPTQLPINSGDGTTI